MVNDLFKITIKFLRDFFSIDPFERPLPFQRSKNECGELVIALSPVRVGKDLIINKILNFFY